MGTIFSQSLALLRGSRLNRGALNAFAATMWLSGAACGTPASPAAVESVEDGGTQPREAVADSGVTPPVGDVGDSFPADTAADAAPNGPDSDTILLPPDEERDGDSPGAGDAAASDTERDTASDTGDAMVEEPDDDVGSPDTGMDIELPPDSGDFSEWVFADGTGGLAYRTTSRGDRIPDFSYAGYGGGGVAFPTAPEREVLSPNPRGDDTARIQAAIDAVSALPPDANGMRGVVRLTRGEYRIRGQLRIAASGVILRGQGRHSEGTVLRATGTDQRSLIVLGGEGRPQEIAGTRQNIIDAYVPVGAMTFRVNDASAYAVGQRVIVERPSTQQWLDHIGMDDCSTVGTAYDTSDINDRTCLEVPWEVGRRELEFDRVVTQVSGNEITLDAPLTMALDATFGGAFVYQIEFPGRIRNSGIERVRGVSDFDGPEDEDHSWTFIELTAVEDAWVDQVLAQHFAYSTALVGRWSRRVTIQDSRNIDPVSLIDGRRRYAFKIERATQVLVQRCDTRDGRHDFVLGQLTVGPNVFLDGTSVDANADVGPHAGWSPGVLFDRISTDDAINIRNRGNMGTNHGWVSANSVVWNSEAPEMIISSPPGSQNWCIGCVTRDRQGDGIWDSPQVRVWPDSLYLAQREQRLGAAALAAIGATP